jgi:acetyl esterase/lipase
MIRLHLVLLVHALALAALASTSSGEPATRGAAADTAGVPASRAPDKEVVYKKTAQGDMKLFVYLPADWKKSDHRPAILFLHGGGWTQGKPDQFYSKSEYLASRGMVAFNVDYRMRSTTHTGMKECVEDARSAMRFVRKNAADWGVNPERIVGSGGSAGGHLAATLAIDTFDDPADDLTISCQPQALVLYNPVLDFPAIFGEAHAHEMLWFTIPGKSSDEEKIKLLTDCSPAEHLKKDTPPTLIFYGDNDSLLNTARPFAENSIALGNKVDIIDAPKVGHGFFNQPGWHQTTLVKTDQFLASLNFLQGPPTVQGVDPAFALYADKSGHGEK